MSARVLAGTLVLLLAGCAIRPDALAPVPRPPWRVAALQDFAEQHREAARQAARQGRWADAVWASEVVLALDPGDAAAGSARARALAAIAAGVAERRPLAAQARQRGDLEAAQRLQLEILALAPDDAAAADALREIERQRTRRGNVAGYRAAPARQPAAPPGRNALEHASLLADQGELDAAIGLLRPVVSGPQASSAARAALADLYWRQALRLQARGDAAGARSALQRCLELAPGWQPARERLAALDPTSADTSR